MIAATGLRSAPPPSPAAAVAVIDLKAVTKVYAGRDGGSVRALGPVDLRIEPGKNLDCPFFSESFAGTNWFGILPRGLPELRRSFMMTDRQRRSIGLTN